MPCTRDAPSLRLLLKSDGKVLRARKSTGLGAKTPGVNPVSLTSGKPFPFSGLHNLQRLGWMMSGELSSRGWDWGKLSHLVSHWDTARMEGEAAPTTPETASPCSCKRSDVLWALMSQPLAQLL